jgi:hypothetical protein
MSSFTWLDYSEHDRQKAMEVVRLFAEKGTVDELGIGTVRDAFSDLLFPGTSTLHTRARYFLFIPWVYRRLEGREWGSGAELAAQARKDELALIGPLVEGGETEGVIGIEARQSLKRLPSLLYWQGLWVLGFRICESGRAAFHRQLAVVSRRRGSDALRTDDGEVVSQGGRVFWHPAIPEAPKGFPKEVSFQLTSAEARYIQDRARERVGQSLLAWLLREGKGLEEAAFPWEHPRLGEMRADHREQLQHARNLSDAMHGAPLLYNLMLAEQADRNGLVELYREAMAEWAESLAGRNHELRQWDQNAMWKLVLRQNPRVAMRTQDFVGRWLAIACNPVTAAAVPQNTKARGMIADRERALKGAQARLGNRRALELWNGDAGTAPLSYRWSNVQSLVADVLAAT